MKHYLRLFPSNTQFAQSELVGSRTSGEKPLFRTYELLKL